MKTRKCSSCKETKSVTYFAKKGKWLQSHCRECNKARLKKHYQDNPQYYSDKARRWKNKQYAKIEKLKSQPCMDCGQTFHPAAMDFDHRPDEQKEFNIANSHANYSMKRVLAEIAKCDLVCACCHRIRTYKRNNGDGSSVRQSAGL